MTIFVRSLAATLASCSLGLLVSSSAGAAPKPPPKFWSVGRCERVLLDVYGYGSRLAPGGFPLPAGDGHVFHVRDAICVGSGGADACRRTAGRRSRLYSVFKVLALSPLDGGVVRTWTLATPAGNGLAPVAHHAGDQYKGWPPDFYMSRVARLATGATPARLRSLAAGLAARAARQRNEIGCTGG